MHPPTSDDAEQSPAAVAAEIHDELLRGSLAGTSILFFHIPFCLADDGPQTAREIASTLGVRRQSVHRIISELQEAGYIERAPEASIGRTRRYKLAADAATSPQEV